VTSGICHVFFDISQTPFVPNLLYSTATDHPTLKTAYLQYIDFFMHSYFDLDAPLSPADLSQLASTFLIDDDYLRRLAADRNLSPRDPPLLTSPMTLPLFRLQGVKLPQLEERMEVRPPPRGGLAMFLSGRHIIVKRMIFDPLRAARSRGRLRRCSSSTASSSSGVTCSRRRCSRRCSRTRSTTPCSGRRC
jgi:hypothetical protein